jgi:hypothetical protein
MYQRRHSSLSVEVVLHPKRFPGVVLDYAADLVVRAVSGTYGDYHASVPYCDGDTYHYKRKTPGSTGIFIYQEKPRPIVRFYKGRAFNKFFEECLGNPNAPGAGESEENEEVLT